MDSRASRERLLLELYRRSDRDPSRFVEESVVGKDLGFSTATTRRAVGNLELLGQVKRGEVERSDGKIAITIQGIRAAEDLRPNPISSSASAEAPLIFISHSSRDKPVARRLVDLLKAALVLRPEEIRCTSVEGHRLPIGARTESQLRTELMECKVFLGLISEISMDSPWVLFELGARWGAGKDIHPLLAPGAKEEELAGPLGQFNALSCGSAEQLHQLVEDLAKRLGRKAASASSYYRELEGLRGSSPTLREDRVDTADGETLFAPKLAVQLSDDDLWVVHCLGSLDGATVAQVVTKTRWSQTRARHHLDRLVDAGLAVLKSTREGDSMWVLVKEGRRVFVERKLGMPPLNRSEPPW